MEFRYFLPQRLLAAIFLLCLNLPCAEPLVDQICVSLGYESIGEANWIGLYHLNKSGLYDHGAKPNRYCMEQFRHNPTSPLSKNSPSIGGQRYESNIIGTATLSLYKAALGLSHLDQSLLSECCDPYDTSKADITVYGVKHNGRFLNGWLSFEVNMKEDIAWAFVQVSDERANAIGEFVIPPEETCEDPIKTPASATPNRLQFLPCSATGLQEAKPSQGVVYTKYTLNTNTWMQVIEEFTGIPADESKGLKMRFTWRLNEYYCNRHSKFRVVLYFLRVTEIPNTFGKTNFQRGDWLTPKWYGVADIVPKASSQNLSCNDEITANMLNANKNAFWIDDIAATTMANDNLLSSGETEGLNFPPSLYKSCRTYLTRLQEYRLDVSKQPSYGGRCEKIDEKKFKPAFYNKAPAPSNPHSTSSVDVPHQCTKNPKGTYPAKMDNYKTYVAKRMDQRKSLCTSKATTCPRLKNLTQKDILKELYKGRQRASNATGRYIMRSRAYHGMMFTWSALYFIPISNFLARFFKETFLSEDVAGVGVRVWYFAHMALIIMAINVSLSGIISNYKVARVWGRSWSEAGARHRILGWSCMGLFVLSLILGPYRPLNPYARLVIMGLHAFVGYLQYFIGLFTIINSSLIPGSPSATGCYKNYSYDPFVAYSFNDAFNHKITTAVMWWLCLDILFYAMMSVMQLRADRSWDIQRRHYFPLVPIVQMNDRKSFKGFRYRTFVLCIYIFILSIIVLVTSLRLYASDWVGCDCGPLTCTHANLSPESVYPEVQCGGLAYLRKLRKSAGLQNS